MKTEWWNRIAAVLEAWEIAYDATEAGDTGEDAREARRVAVNDVGHTFTDFARTYPHAHNQTQERIYELLESNGRIHNDMEPARRYAKMVGLDK